MAFRRCSNVVVSIPALMIGGIAAEVRTSRCLADAGPCHAGDLEDAALLQMPAQERHLSLEMRAAGAVSLHQWNLGHPKEGDEELFQSAVQYIAGQIKSNTVDFFNVVNYLPKFPTASLGSYGAVRSCCDDGCSMLLFNMSRWKKITEIGTESKPLCLTDNGKKTPATMAIFETAGSARLAVVGTHLPFDPPLWSSWDSAVSSLHISVGGLRKSQPSEDPVALLADTNVGLETNQGIFKNLNLTEGAHTPTTETTCCYDSFLKDIHFKPDRIIASFSPGFSHSVDVGTPAKWFKNMHNPISVTIPFP